MKVIRSKRKTIALIITSTGELMVRAPMRTPKNQIEELVRRKSGWIEEKQALMRQFAAEAQPHHFEPGETFYYLGKEYPLELVDHPRIALSFNGTCFQLARAAQPQAAGIFSRWYRQQAAQFLPTRVAALASQYGFLVQKVRITSARTRWGSCSTRGTLSFPWRLVMAPAPVIDYVVIHELAHLKEHNHSARFWAVVAGILPQYRELLAWLMHNGHKLEIGSPD